MILPDSTETSHPYLGYVLNDLAEPSAWHRLGWPAPKVNRFGFEGLDFDADVPQGTLRVGLFGGSVAKMLALSNHLQKALNARDDAPPSTVFACALNGYKQPQQLFLLMYLLALGIKWDVVINLDGFNEVALFEPENARQGVHPLYPRAWYSRVSRGRDGRATSLSLLIQSLDRTAAWLNAHSATGLRQVFRRLALIATALGRGARRRLGQHLNHANGNILGAVARGPGRPSSNLNVVYDELATVWFRSSLLMRNACDAHGAQYVHALQPNQYVAGSKPMGEAEQRVAVRETHPYRLGVTRGYGRLRARGVQLSDAGVQFVDLTQVFQSVHEPVYADSCCHLNDLGHHLLGGALAAAVSTMRAGSRLQPASNRHPS
jgi:hypothetical protein